MESNVQAYEDLKDRIIYGFYPYKAHLGIKQVADDIGASQVEVRRALARLIEDKLVVHHQSRGFFVISNDACIDMLDYRNELERFAIRQAVDRITPEQHSHLAGLAKKLDSFRPLDDLRLYVDVELAFHHYIVQCSANSFLIDMYEPVNNLLKQFISNIHLRLSRKDKRYSDMNIFISHSDVVDSIRMAQLNNMPEIAVKALDTHLLLAYSLDMDNI